MVRFRFAGAGGAGSAGLDGGGLFAADALRVEVRGGGGGVRGGGAHPLHGPLHADAARHPPRRPLLRGGFRGQGVGKQAAAPGASGVRGV
eukprot:348978-Pyramimonas_sp.AAC.1